MSANIENFARKLRSLDIPLHAPATDTELTRLSECVRCDLPDAIRELYTDHNGEGLPPVLKRALNFRLMTIDEVCEFHNCTPGLTDYPLGQRFFWTDDNSNYAGVFVSPLLNGRVVFMDHEEYDPSPRFRNIEELLAAIVMLHHRETGDWHTDWPEDFSGNQCTEEDWRVAQELTEMYLGVEDENLKKDYAFCAMILTPASHTESIIRFTHDDDMWTPERACEILGSRKYQPAIPRLVELAEKGMPNADGAAFRALLAIGTYEALCQAKRLYTLRPNLFRYGIPQDLLDQWENQKLRPR